MLALRATLWPMTAARRRLTARAVVSCIVLVGTVIILIGPDVHSRANGRAMSQRADADQGEAYGEMALGSLRRRSQPKPRAAAARASYRQRMPTFRVLVPSSPARITLSTAGAAYASQCFPSPVRMLRCGAGRGVLDGGCQRSGWGGCARPRAVWASAGRAGRALPGSGLLLARRRPSCWQSVQT